MSSKPQPRKPFRETAKEASGALIEVASPLLKDVVDYADNIFWPCLEAAEPLEDYAPLVLYRHIIEMADGIEVLISQGCSGPAVPLLRTCFEQWLSLTYILQPGKKYEQRSLAWLCSYIHGAIEQKEMLDRDTPKGNKLLKSLAKEAPELIEKLCPAKDMGNLKELLTEPYLAAIEAEYQRLKHKSKYPYWCSLVGGPSSFSRLADHLRRGAPYHVWYGPWSVLIHGFDASRFLRGLSDGAVEFKPLRDPEGLRDNTYRTELMVNDATKLMIRKFIPQEALDFFQWESEINKRVERLERFVLKRTAPS